MLLTGRSYTIYRDTVNQGNWVYRGLIYDMLVFSDKEQSGAILNIPSIEGTLQPESPWRIIAIN